MTDVLSLFAQVPAKEWVTVVLPAWMQGIATVAGVILAWSAYMQWRRPDDARRRGDTAQQMIRISQKKLEIEALIARYSNVVSQFEGDKQNFDRKLKSVTDAIQEPKTREVANLKAAINELQTYKAEAEVLFKSEVAKAMGQLRKTCQELVDAHRSAEWLVADVEVLTDADAVNSFVDNIMAVIGIRIMEHRKNDLTPRLVPDAYASRLTVQGDKLRKALAPFV